MSKHTISRRTTFIIISQCKTTKNDQPSAHRLSDIPHTDAVTVPIPTASLFLTCTLPIPIHIYGIFLFPLPWDFYGNPTAMGIPFPRTSLVVRYESVDEDCNVIRVNAEVGRVQDGDCCQQPVGRVGHRRQRN